MADGAKRPLNRSSMQAEGVGYVPGVVGVEHNGWGIAQTEEEDALLRGIEPGEVLEERDDVFGVDLHISE